MTNEGNGISAEDFFLLTLKGQILIEFIDGDTLEGEFVTQDALNIFVKIDGEPVMISRSQIRFIKGRQSQQIEKDQSQVEFLTESPTPYVREQKEPEILSPGVDELDETEGTVVLMQEAEEFVTSPGAITPDESFKVQDVGIEFDEDEDPTLVFEDESEEVELEEATFVLPQDKMPPSEISAHLECTAGPHAGEVFELKRDVTTVGRSSDNDVSLAYDKEISRKHSLITYEAGSFIIEDQNSLNGTFVNEERVETPRQLADGDTIFVGVSTLMFHEK